MVGQQHHTNEKYYCWKRPQGHNFFITKTWSKRLCTRYCWRNMVSRRSGWSLITGLKCDFDSSRKRWTFGWGPLLCQRFRRRREETVCKRRRKEISLVFVIVMLHVLKYVVSNNLFWNWNGVMQFVFQEVWSDNGFVIWHFCKTWHFCKHCLVRIVSLWSFSIGVQIISTTNELVDRIENFKWNASPNDSGENFLFKICAAGQIFCSKNAPQARLMKQNEL